MTKYIPEYFGAGNYFFIRAVKDIWENWFEVFTLCPKIKIKIKKEHMRSIYLPLNPSNGFVASFT